MLRCRRCNQDLDESVFVPSMRPRADRWCKSCMNEYRRDIHAGRLRTNHREGEACRACGADLSGRPRNVIYCGEKCRMSLFLAARPGFHEAEWLRKAYGMTVEERDTLLASQGGRCAICGASDVEVWHVDHCHDSGTVRGMLCRSCNIGLGHFHDDPARLKAAIIYLTR